MISSPLVVEKCSKCGHPVREKEGHWKHTNTMDGHVFSTKACQQCIIEGKECRDASPADGMRVSVQELPTVPELKKTKEEHYVICKVCGIYAKSRAALMRHYRDEHPLDPDKLRSLQREGKSIEEMAVILERIPQTVSYHIEKLSAEDQLNTHAEQPEEEGETDIAGAWTRIFHLESSGEGTQEGVQAVKNAVRSAIPYRPTAITLDVNSNKTAQVTRIVIEVRKK